MKSLKGLSEQINKKSADTNPSAKGDKKAAGFVPPSMKFMVQRSLETLCGKGNFSYKEEDIDYNRNQKTLMVPFTRGKSKFTLGLIKGEVGLFNDDEKSAFVKAPNIDELARKWKAKRSRKKK